MTKSIFFVAPAMLLSSASLTCGDRPGSASKPDVELIEMNAVQARALDQYLNGSSLRAHHDASPVKWSLNIYPNEGNGIVFNAVPTETRFLYQSALMEVDKQGHITRAKVRCLKTETSR